MQVLTRCTPASPRRPSPPRARRARGVRSKQYIFKGVFRPYATRDHLGCVTRETGVRHGARPPPSSSAPGIAAREDDRDDGDARAAVRRERREVGLERGGGSEGVEGE